MVDQIDCSVSSSYTDTFKAAFPKLFENLDKMRDHLGPKSVSEDKLSLHQSDEPYAHGQVRVLLYNGQVRLDLTTNTISLTY